MRRFEPARNDSRRTGRRAQRGVVLFITLILLLILTVLGVSMARQQTVEERLAQNDNNHQLALETAEAALVAAFDADAGGQFTDFSGDTPGLATLAAEIATPPSTTLGFNVNWDAPGVNTVIYNGATLTAAPAASQPQYVVEELAPAVPPGCNSGNGGNYNGGSTVTIHRITAHAAGGDGTASATVQAIRVGSC